MGVGYQSMYVVSIILNDVQTQSILETGLGQSTRLIGSFRITGHKDLPK